VGSLDGEFVAGGRPVEAGYRVISRTGSPCRPWFFLRDAAGQSAQRLSTPRQPRAYCPDWNVENCGDLIVAHSLECNEQNYRTLRVGQLGEGALEISELEPFSLLRCARQHRLAIRQSDCRSFASGSADMINVLMMQYRKQPCSQICPLSPEMQPAEGPRKTVLDEIISDDGVMRQGACVATQAGNFGFDVPMLAGHQRHSERCTIGQMANHESADSICVRLSYDVRATAFV
jgi:hypothetical protein